MKTLTYKYKITIETKRGHIETMFCNHTAIIASLLKGSKDIITILIHDLELNRCHYKTTK